MEIQTFAEQLSRWRRGERNEALEVKIKAVKRTGRTHARLWKHITAVVWREVKPWIGSMVDEAKNGGIPMGGDAPDISGALMRGVRDAVEVGYRQGKQTVREIQKKISLADDWHDVLPAEALSWIQGYVPELARVYEADVLEQVRDKIAASLRAGKTEKHVARELRQIQGQVEKFSRHRLEAIARTESMRGYNMGHLRGMIDSKGVAGVEFSAILDSRTSEPCQAREGLRFPLGSPELVYNSPPLHPNCRSVLIPVMDVEVPPGWTGDEDRAWALRESCPTIQRDSDIDSVRKVLGEKARGSAEKVGFVAARTVEDAERWIVEQGYAEQASYKGMTVEQANAMNKAVFDSVKQVPGMQKLGFLGTMDEHSKLVPGLKARNSDASGVFTARNGKAGISINLENLEGVPGILEKRDRLSGARWNLSESVYGTVSHEMGHAIAWETRAAGEPGILKKWQEMKNSKGLLGLPNASSRFKKELSEYGGTKIHEFIAEGWCEYMTTKNPRPVAQAIVEGIFRGVDRWIK